MSDLLENIKNADPYADPDHVCDLIVDVVYEIERLQKDNDELQQAFDMRWQATQRAIKVWQTKHPSSDLTWPDHAELIVWLLDEIESLRAQVATLREALMSTEERCSQWAEIAGKHGAEVYRLKAAIKTQANAVRTLQKCDETEINRLRKTHQQAHIATQTLDSEREANAVLTAENDRLRAAAIRARAALADKP